MSDVVIQRACDDITPDDEALAGWANAALVLTDKRGEITLRLVGADEMQTLNRTYRNKDALTNVLSFPVENDIRTRHDLLGDVVICPVVVADEARRQHKPTEAHYAHLVIHGVLHLLGFDHLTDEEATQMEALETRLLASFDISDPYVERVANLN